MAISALDDGVIRLRPLSDLDAATHLAGCDRVIVDSLGGGTPPTETEVRSWLKTNASAWANGAPVVDLGVEDIATGVLCGNVGIQRGLEYLDIGQVNLTYSLYPDWRGRGYATRATRLAMDVARRTAPVTQFVIRASGGNNYSIAVAQRLKFAHSHTSDDEHGRLEWFFAS